MATEPTRRISPGIIVVGVIVVIAVIALVVVNLSGGDSQPEPTARPGAIGGVGAAPTPAPTTEPTEVFEIFEGRDPFRPLIVPAAEGGGGGASPAPSASPGAGGGGGGTAPTPTPRDTTRNGVQVELMSVADDRGSATVRVGSKVFQGVKPGQTLDAGVVMDSILDSRCAMFHRGDESFRLCEGELILK